jgi:hypothetical protein
MPGAPMREVALVCCMGTFLAGCLGSGPDPAMKALTSHTVECFVAEAHRIAPKPVDLDTAAYAVLAACKDQISAERVAVFAVGGPEWVEESAKAWASIQDQMLNRARTEVAAARTK